MRWRRPASMLLLVGLLGVTACTSTGPSADPTPSSATVASSATPGPPAPAPATSPTAGSTRSSTPTTPPPTVAEPTTTNTLPPPPRPSKPAPSTAGKLTASSLPVPAGWKTVARKGSSEEGYEGNGTWVHARDPRYAAQAVITLGCAEVTRDDYPDPTAALEGTYEKGKNTPGIGLVLQFASEKSAQDFYAVYLKQVNACRSGDGPVTTKVIASDLGLIDQRSYPDGDWTEAGALHGARLTLVILADDGHRITPAQSETLIRQIISG